MLLGNAAEGSVGRGGGRGDLHLCVVLDQVGRKRTSVGC